ncbi:MAG: glycosyltransferase family 39 protein [Elusimicrobiota bacterium]|jgi:hypothetical protein
MIPPSRRLALALIAAASLAMHLKGLTTPPLDYHYHRQCNTAAIARNFHEHGLRLFQPQIDWDGPNDGRAATEFPLYMWLMGLLWPWAGLAAVWGRILSAAFSALTACYLFFLVEEDSGRRPAFWAGLLFSCLPLEIYFGRTIQPEAIALCATVAALYHWRQALGPARPWKHWLAATACLFLAVAHKLPAAYVFAPLAWLAWERRGRAMFMDWRVWASPLLAAAGVLAWYCYAKSRGNYVVPTNPTQLQGLLNYSRIGYYMQFQFLSRFPELAATHAGLLFLAAGAWITVRKERRMFYAVWFLSVAAALIAYGGYAFHHEYTSLPFTPVNAALMGIGLSFLVDKAASLRPPRRGQALAGLALLALYMPAYGMFRIKHWYRQSFPALDKAETAAALISAPSDLFLSNERAPSVFLFAMHRRGWWVDLAQPQAETGLDDYIRRGARFFAAEKTGIFQDRSGATASRFYARFPVAYDDGKLLIFRLRPQP